MSNANKNFNFFIPLELEKGKDEKTGKEKMIFKGIASTVDKDSDGEFLDPKGFELDYFLKSGFTNWNHQSKNNPIAIIGEPTKASVTDKGLYIETELYNDSKLAKEVWDLAQAMEKSGSKRKLGFSIEGKKLETDPLNDKIITKARITGVAITPTPKNSNTFADICKGIYNDTPLEYEIEKEEIIKSEAGEETKETYLVDLTDENGHRITVDKSFSIKMVKALSTSTGGAVIKEDVEGSKKKNIEKKLSKGEIYEKIFYYLYDIEKADRVYRLIQNLELKRNPTMNTISIEANQDTVNEVLLKLEKSFTELSEKPVETVSAPVNIEAILEKASLHVVSMLEKGHNKESICKAMKDSNMDDTSVSKAFEKGETIYKEKSVKEDKITPPAVIVKAESIDIEKGEKGNDFSILIDLIKSQGVKQEDFNNSVTSFMTKTTEELTTLQNSTSGRKSVTTKKFFEKAEDVSFEKGQNTALSITTDKHKIVNLIDSFIDYGKIEKGEQSEVSLATANSIFEAAGTFGQDLFSFLQKKAPHVKLVK